MCCQVHKEFASGQSVKSTVIKGLKDIGQINIVSIGRINLVKKEFKANKECAFLNVFP